MKDVYSFNSLVRCGGFKKENIRISHMKQKEATRELISTGKMLLCSFDVVRELINSVVY